MPPPPQSKEKSYTRLINAGILKKDSSTGRFVRAGGATTSSFPSPRPPAGASLMGVNSVNRVANLGPPTNGSGSSGMPRQAAQYGASHMQRSAMQPPANSLLQALRQAPPPQTGMPKVNLFPNMYAGQVSNSSVNPCVGGGGMGRSCL